MNLHGNLLQIVPPSITWTKLQAEHIAKFGQSLPPLLEEVARRVGVQNPERIRILVVDQIPIPDEPLLKQWIESKDLFGPDMHGLTLGHSIFVVKDHEHSLPLLSHEFRHVFQYELFGSIDEFLPIYLRQVTTCGYQDSPLEVDARKYQLQPMPNTREILFNLTSEDK